MSDQTKSVQPGAGERSFTVPTEVAVLPLRDTVLFPNSFMPLAVARESSVKLIDEAIAGGKLIGVFTQRDPGQEEPGQADLHAIGTLTYIHKMFKLPDGSLRLIVQGLSRIRLESVTTAKPYIKAQIAEVPDVLGASDALEIDALQRNIRTNFQQVVQLSPAPHMPSPQPVGQEPQSGTQLLHVSPPKYSHMPLPQRSWHGPQSNGHVEQFSYASH